LIGHGKNSFNATKYYFQNFDFLKIDQTKKDLILKDTSQLELHSSVLNLKMWRVWTGARTELE
jgi:hypothetical protein